MPAVSPGIMNRLQLLDYGRFLAACSVLACHYFFNGIANHKVASIHHVPGLAETARYGYLGVDFFFLISGYVILLSARGKSASQFAVSRAVRLLPAYWVAMLITSGLASVWGGDMMSVTLPQVLANLTMVAPFFGQGYVDGVYWTLDYELRFYAAVFVLLLVGQSSRLETWCLAWLVLMALVRLSGIADAPFLGGSYVFFASGCLLAVMKDRRGPVLRPLASVALYLCFTTAVEEAAAKTMEDGYPIRPWISGVAVAGFFIFFAVLNTERGSSLRLPGARLAGGLTYPLYLIHAHVGYMLLSHLATDARKAWIYPIVVAAVFGLALAIHLLVERRLAAMWRRLFEATAGLATQRMGNAVTWAGRLIGWLRA